MKRFLAITLTLILSILAVCLVIGSRPARVTPVADEDLGLCVPPLVCVTVSVPVPVTVRATVKVPVTVRATVRLPVITNIITLPPVLRTIVVPRTVTVGLPGGGTRTVTAQGLPGATKTATVVVNREIIRNGTAPPITREVRSTISGQTNTTSATVHTKEVVRLPGTNKTVTRLQAVGLSLLALILLMALGLFLLWLGFILGYRSSDKENIGFLRSLRDTIVRPGKHE